VIFATLSPELQLLQPIDVSHCKIGQRSVGVGGETWSISSITRLIWLKRSVI